MPDNEANKSYRGFVSAYLKQPPRTLAEAEKDRRGHNPDATTRESEAAQDPRSNASGPSPTDGER